ncbi:hypothetical protein IJJ18_01680 [Candidatus Saccharibacteria bacterium]|nr:hypothetical protein [Candidatus Saccharibacteria bacterium]
MKSKKGFTIVELSLSSAFLGILLITIALLVTHIITIYQKGMTLKSVNTVGEDLIDNFTRSITASPAINLKNLCDNQKCADDNGYKYMYQQRYTSVQIVGSGEKIEAAPTTGAFCTGKYSYVWNSGYILDDDNETYVKPGTEPGKDGGSLASERAVLIRGADGDKNKNIWPDKGSLRLIRVKDANREVCRSGIEDDGATYDNPGESYRVSDPNAEVTELLEKSEDNLAIYDLTIFRPTYHANTQHAFYSGTFILATISGGVNIMAAGDYCTDTAKDNLSTDFAYCAMNKFNFATRATGMGGVE